MTRWLAIAVTVVLGVTRVAAGADAADGRRASRQSDFGAYRMILDRNVFDPQRRTAREQSYRPRPMPERRPDPVLIALQGVYIEDGVPQAFLGSGNPQYGGAFSIGDQVAGFRIVAIDTRKVILNRDGEILEWPTGKQLTDNAEGRWTLDTSGAGRTQPAADAAAASAATNPSDILRMLAEKQKRELGQ